MCAHGEQGGWKEGGGGVPVPPGEIYRGEYKRDELHVYAFTLYSWALAVNQFATSTRRGTAAAADLLRHT